MNTNTPISTRLSSQLSAVALAMAAMLPLAVSAPAVAQTRTVASAAAPTISSFDVQSLQRLRPGEVLTFELRATPGAVSMLQIDGASAPVEMTEVRPGQYEGSYTIRQSDRLTENSRVTARVLRNGRAASASLARSLQLGSPDVGFVSTNAITDFQVTAPERVRPGEELNFSLRGAPGGKARVAIDGAKASVPLREVSRGVYEGSYVVRRGDRLRNGLTANAFLVNSGRESTQRFERVLVNDDNRGGNRQPQPLACSNCGTIESVNLVELKDGRSNVIGTIAGGILGGVVGNQVGGGTGKDIARVIGAVGGAYAGNRVQNNMNKDKVYRVSVRLQGGSTRDFDYAEDPQVTVGTRVKVEGDVLVRQ